MGHGGRAGGIDIIEAEKVRQVWNVSNEGIGHKTRGAGLNSWIVRES